MKFRAKIIYNHLQSREAQFFGDENIRDTVIDFTFKDLFTPVFSIRELVIPWLKQGNIPQIIFDVEPDKPH